MAAEDMDRLRRTGRIAIVGASLAGLRAAETLRAEGFAGELTLIGDEPYEPYDRPPLSKQVLLGVAPADSTGLPMRRDPKAEWVLGVRATGLDTLGKRVLLDNGESLPYDRVLIATGTRARPWPNPAEAALDGVFTVRTREDAAGLAAALDAGVVTDPDARTDSPDPYRLPGTRTTLTNEADGCVDTSLRDAFEWSCNTVFAKLGVDVGVRDMTATAEAFGFNDGGLRVPFSVATSTFDSHVDKAQLALSSIGQYNTRATPLQMAMVAAAVADDGRLHTPYLVERTTRHDGETVAGSGTHPVRQVMHPYTAAQLKELMTGVVREGTGTRAAIPGAIVGGKTGTAQHGVDNTGLPYAWFVSWAQDQDAVEPAVAVAVVVEDASADRGEISGGGDAAPIARDVMRAVLGR